MRLWADHAHGRASGTHWQWGRPRSPIPHRGRVQQDLPARGDIGRPGDPGQEL